MVELDLDEIPSSYADGSIDEIESNYQLTYLNGIERIAFMEECYRILKPSGKLTIKVPHWSCIRSISDPFFKWPPICETSFLVFNKEWRKTNQQEDYPISCDFDYGYGFGLMPELSTRNEEYKQYATKHYNNAILDLIVNLTKR